MILSRGDYTGEILDALSSVAERVTLRCSVGVTSIARYVEDFYKQILNLAFDYELENANEDRANAPGLDLIDHQNNIGFQITATASSDKVNSTLEQVVELDNPPDEIRVLVVGKRQGSYTLDEQLCDETRFSENDIWGTQQLMQKMMGVEISKLKRVHECIQNELARVKSELEEADEDGRYQTDLEDEIESRPEPGFTNFDSFIDYLIDIEPEEANVQAQTRSDLRDFIANLTHLPRVTREFFAFLLERRDREGYSMSGRMSFNHNRLKRLCAFDYAGDLDILERSGLARLTEPDPRESRHVIVYEQGEAGFLLVYLVGFMENEGIDFNKPIRDLDFSDFAS